MAGAKNNVVFAAEKEPLHAEIIRIAIQLNEGKTIRREDIVAGLENAPQAVIGLLKGKNFAKLMIRLAKGWFTHFIRS